MQDGAGYTTGHGQGRSVGTGAALFKPRFSLEAFPGFASKNKSSPVAVRFFVRNHQSFSCLCASWFVGWLFVWLSMFIILYRIFDPSMAMLLLVYPQLGAPTQVFKISFWMRGFGSKTPKRTTLWSNSSAIRFFHTSRKARKLVKAKLADTYRDKQGRKRFKGNSNLRKSQCFGYVMAIVVIFGFFPFMLQTQYCKELHCTEGYHVVKLRAYPIGFGVRFAQTMGKFHRERSELLAPSYVPFLALNASLHWI